MNKLVAVLALVGFGLSGCVVHSDDDDEGIFAVDWEIAGSRRVSACDAYGVDVISIEVVSRTSSWSQIYDQPCEDFGVDIPLLPDSYSANAELLDFDGYTITTNVNLGTFRIVDSFDVIPVVAVFPDDSFL